MKERDRDIQKEYAKETITKSQVIKSTTGIVIYPELVLKIL